MLWLMVSNAAERSRLTRTAVFLLLVAWYIPSRIESRAVSVEHPERYADCIWLKFDELVSCDGSRVNARRSSMLETVFRLKIGRKFANCIVSWPHFFSRGRTCAVLKHCGNRPLANDMLAIFLMIGTKLATHDFGNDVGTTSSGEVLAGMLAINLVIFAEVVWWSNSREPSEWGLSWNEIGLTASWPGEIAVRIHSSLFENEIAEFHTHLKTFTIIPFTAVFVGMKHTPHSLP
jgi:hypothetical protein